MSQDGYRCQSCGELHEGRPLAYGLAAPDYWHEGLAADQLSELWASDGRDAEPPYFGYLSNQIAAYPVSTLDLKCHVHTQPTDHPLAVEQRSGITLDRVRQIAETVRHQQA